MAIRYSDGSRVGGWKVSLLSCAVVILFLVCMDNPRFQHFWSQFCHYAGLVIFWTIRIIIAGIVLLLLYALIRKLFFHNNEDE